MVRSGKGWSVVSGSLSNNSKGLLRVRCKTVRID